MIDPGGNPHARSTPRETPYIKFRVLASREGGSRVGVGYHKRYVTLSFAACKLIESYSTRITYDSIIDFFQIPPYDEVENLVEKFQGLFLSSYLLCTYLYLNRLSADNARSLPLTA
jgi:hypothetical protein